MSQTVFPDFDSLEGDELAHMWQLVDQRLDGELDDAAWQAAVAQYGSSIEQAWQQAEVLQQGVQQVVANTAHVPEQLKQFAYQLPLQSAVPQVTEQSEFAKPGEPAEPGAKRANGANRSLLAQSNGSNHSSERCNAYGSVR